MKETPEIRQKIAEIANQPLENHGEIFAEINDSLATQLREIETS